MSTRSPRKLVRVTVLTLGFLLLPEAALGIVGGVDPWLTLLMPLGAALVAGLGVVFVKSELRELTLLAPLASVGLLAVLASPGPIMVLLAGIAAIAVLVWMGSVLTTFGNVRDASVGVALPMMGLAVAAAITFLVPSGHAYIGVAAALVALGLVLVAVILALMVPERPLPLPS
jgi:hypothetical protein